jgi:hypothetical protein
MVTTAQVIALKASFAAKHEAMERVDRNANAQWKKVMYALGVETAKRMPHLTSDEIFDLYDATLQTAWTHEKRALGAVMQRLARDGIIRKSALPHRPSRRKTLHASPLQVWDSLIFW